VWESIVRAELGFQSIPESSPVLVIVLPFHEWLSDVIKQSDIVINYKSRAIVKCSSEETFGSLISKVATEF